ncbi:HAD family hydrolase, partial [Paraconexibacter sp.]|uniref:HAD family hydrolase n=1 Tax=Paraconexibacter sp. TaxID=2949640 RepID=UPI0035679FB5
MPERSGLLLDWGGVMTTNLFEAFSAFCAEEGLALEAVAQAFRDDPAAREALIDLECGRIEIDAFEPRLAVALGLAEDRATGLVGRLFGAVAPEPAMLDAVVALRAGGVRTGLLSNSWGGASYDRARFTELFDVLVVSGEEGMRKPDPRIYELALRRIGLPPEEVVFVDDLPFNLKPPREMGIHTIHHTSAAETIPQLEELLGVRV